MDTETVERLNALPEAEEGLEGYVLHDFKCQRSVEAVGRALRRDLGLSYTPVVSWSRRSRFIDWVMRLRRPRAR